MTFYQNEVVNCRKEIIWKNIENKSYLKSDYSHISRFNLLGYMIMNQSFFIFFSNLFFRLQAHCYLQAGNSSFRKILQRIKNAQIDFIKI